MSLIAAGMTHPGRVRPHNEDALVCEPQRGLIAVIDGMGGEAAGEVAAAIAREQILSRGAPREALAAANAAIVARAEANPAERGMGCVATAAHLSGHRLTLAHVGDTRAYLISAAGLEQLTRDHTVVAELREQQGMTEAQARALPNQHRVTRDLGGQLRDGTDWIDTGEVDLQPDDLLLLCSDGLHDLVRDGELSRILGAARSHRQEPEAVARELVELALSRGGHDNITVVVARFTASSAPTPRPPRVHRKPEEPPRVLRKPAPPAPGPRRSGMPRVLLALVLSALAFVVGRLSVSSPEAAPTPPVPLVLEPPLVEWRVAAGQTMTLSGADIQSPSAVVSVELAAGAQLVIADSTLVLDALLVRGPPDASVKVVDSTLTMRGNAPQVEGPILTVEETAGALEEPLEETP
ncbi:MAG: SpoIIE family protein phosphatase [Myxococcota bacterium]|nr:SpoIIE family protein phosphatase [Myxococcota bacterium]